MQKLEMALSSNNEEDRMNHHSTVTALRVDDQDFLITSTIDRCPKVMMIRELVKNALEAAAEAEAGGNGECARQWDRQQSARGQP